MKLPSGKPMAEAAFDLTPMIDIVLLLIIFFMMTSQFAATTRMPLALPPEKGQADAVESPTSIVIDISKDGTLSILGSHVLFEDAVAMVRTSVTASGGKGTGVDVVVRADRDAAAAHLNRLAAALSKAGVRSLKLATDGQGGGRAG